MDNISIFKYIFNNNKFIIYYLTESEFKKKRVFLMTKANKSLFDNNPSENFVFEYKNETTFKLIKKIYGNKSFNLAKELKYEVEVKYYNNILKLKYGFSYNSLIFFIVVIFPAIFLFISSLINISLILFLLSIFYFILFDFLFNIILKNHIKIYNKEFLKISTPDYHDITK